MTVCGFDRRELRMPVLPDDIFSGIQICVKALLGMLSTELPNEVSSARTPDRNALPFRQAITYRRSCCYQYSCFRQHSCFFARITGFSQHIYGCQRTCFSQRKTAPPRAANWSTKSQCHTSVSHIQCSYLSFLYLSASHSLAI